MASKSKQIQKTHVYLSDTQKQALLVDAAKKKATVASLSERYNVAHGTMRKHLFDLGVKVVRGKIVALPVATEDDLPKVEMAQGGLAAPEELIALGNAVKQADAMAKKLGLRVMVSRQSEKLIQHL